MLLLVICSFIWAIYGLAQKWMLRKLQSQQILLILYVASTVVCLHARLAHASQPDHGHVDALQGWLLARSVAPTRSSPMARSHEALKHWEASARRRD